MLEVKVCHFVTWLRLSKNGFVWGVRKRLGAVCGAKMALKAV